MENEVKKSSGLAGFLYFVAAIVWIVGLFSGVSVYSNENLSILGDNVVQFLGNTVLAQSFFIGMIFFGMGKIINLITEVRYNQLVSKEDSE